MLNASGYVEPRRKATVDAKITGRVTEVLVDEGMTVQAGQVLARLDDADARARYDSSLAEAEVARARRAEIEVNTSRGPETQHYLECMNCGYCFKSCMGDHMEAVDDEEWQRFVDESVPYLPSSR